MTTNIDLSDFQFKCKGLQEIEPLQKYCSTFPDIVQFDQSDLIYVDSGGEQLLFDARPELGKDNVEAAIKKYLKNSGISQAEMSFYGTSER